MDENSAIPVIPNTGIFRISSPVEAAGMNFVEAPGYESPGFGFYLDIHGLPDVISSDMTSGSVSSASDSDFSLTHSEENEWDGLYSWQIPNFVQPPTQQTPDNTPAQVTLQEIQSFSNRFETTLKNLLEKNKNLNEENKNLRELVEGTDESKLGYIKCVICMDLKV